MIYTFYSFKGGVGRSMALANVAEFLCRRGLKVLMVDFDLEAPGLERYFQVDDEKVLKPEVIEAQRGLIDLLISYKNLRSISSSLRISNLELEETPPRDSDFQASGTEQNVNLSDSNSAVTVNLTKSDGSSKRAGKGEEKDEPNGNNKFNFPIEPLANFIVPIYETTERGGSLHLIPAGRRALTLDESDVKKKEELSKKELARYSERVRSFAWNDFDTELEGELFFEWFRTEANKIADIVLIDSRTGFTEMSGVCTYDLPDAVVMFVAGNVQNLEGTVKIAESLVNRELIEQGRKGRELDLLFVPARVDPNEKLKTDNFARRFKTTLESLHTKAVAFEDDAFKDLMVPYVPFYAFEEAVAFRDTESPISALLTKPLEKLCYMLSQLETDKDSKFRALFASKQIPLTRNARVKDKLAEQSFNLLPEETHRKAFCVLDRFVQVEPLDDAKDDVAVNVKLNDFDEDEKKIVYSLETCGLVTIEKNESSKSEKTESNREVIYGLADKTYPQNWKRLKKWLNENRDFLLWRQQLKTFIEHWKQSEKRSDALLTPSQLQTALEWQSKRPDSLNEIEKDYLQQSSKHKIYRRLGLIVVVSLILVVAGLIGLNSWRQSENERKLREAAIEQEKETKAQDFYSQGEKSAQNEDYSSAIVLYSSAIELRPQNAQYYTNRGFAYLRTADYEKSIADLRKAAELNPDDYLAYSYLGEAYYYLTQFQPAIDALSTAISLNPEYSYAYFVRGSSNRDIGEINKAIEDYTKAIELKPDFGAAYLERGWTYDNQEADEKAIADFRKAIEITNIPSIASEAAANLQVLAQTTKSKNLIPKLPPATPILSFQYAEPKDMNSVTDIANSLRTIFQVTRVVFNKDITDIGINYFYAEDRQNAVAVKDLVEEKGLVTKGIRLKLNLVSQERLYKEVARGTIEVRLPSLGLSAESQNRANFKITRLLKRQDRFTDLTERKAKRLKLSGK